MLYWGGGDGEQPVSQNFLCVFWEMKIRCFGGGVMGMKEIVNLNQSFALSELNIQLKT